MSTQSLVTVFKSKTLKIKEYRQSRRLNKIAQLLQHNKIDIAAQKIKTLEKDRIIGQKNKVRLALYRGTVLFHSKELDHALIDAKMALKEAKEIKNNILELESAILTAKILFEQGKLDAALNMAEYGENLHTSISEKEIKRHPSLSAYLYHIKGKIYRKKGELHAALEYLQKSLLLEQNVKSVGFRADLSNDLGVCYASQGKINLALKYFEKSLEYYEKEGHTIQVIKLLNNIGMINWQRGELDNALEYFERGLKLSKVEGTDQFTSGILLNLGLVYWNKGDLTAALKYFEQSLAVFKKLGRKHEIAKCLNNIGLVYQHQGKIELALQYFQQSLEILESIDNKTEMAVTYGNLGNSYQIKGELGKALEYYQKALNISKEIGNLQDIAFGYHNIGSVHHLRGEYKQAIDYYLKSLAEFEKIGNNPYIARITFNLMTTMLNENPHDINRVLPYLEKLEQIAANEDNKLINQLYRLARALILKRSERVVKRAEAQKIFQEISEEEIIDQDITTQAMLNWCEMLLVELRSSGSEEVLQEIKQILEKLLTLAKNQNSYSLLAETYLLQSKMALLELDVKKARQLLNEAQQIAEEKGLGGLALKISNEHDLLLDQMTKWEDFIERNASIRERFELTELADIVTRMIRKKATEIPMSYREEPVMLLIMAESGVTVYSKKFLPTAQLDDMLIGGFLTAINNFVREAFNVSGTIERIKHQEYTLLMKVVETLLFCYVFKGQSYFALQKLDKIVSAIQSQERLWTSIVETSKTGIVPPEFEELSSLIESIVFENAQPNA